MILRYIEVENFLSYRREQISLPEAGVIQLAGNSGSGKSSLVCDAVGFALFGYRATRASKLERLRHLEADTPAFGAKVAFQDASGAIVEIERGVDEDGRSFARFNSSAGDFAEGVQAVGERITAIFGVMDPRVFYRSFVARQDDMAALTEMEGAKRRDFIHEMLGISQLEAVIKRLRANGRDRTALIGTLEGITGSETREDLEAQLQRELADTSRLESEVDAAKVERDGLEAEVAAEDEVLAPLRTARREMAARESTVAVAEARLPDLERQIAVMEDELDQAEAKRDVITEANERRARVSAARSQVDAHRRAEAAEARRAQFEVDLTRQRAEEAQWAPQAEGAEEDGPDPGALREERAGLQATYRGLRERKGELEANQERLAMDGVCATCLRPTEGPEHERLHALFAEQITDTESQMEAIVATGKERATQLEEAEARAERGAARARAKERLGLIQAEIARLEGELAELGELRFDPAAGARAEDELRAAEVALTEITAAEQWLSARTDLSERHRTVVVERDRLAAEAAEAALWLENASRAEDLDAREAALTTLRAELAGVTTQVVRLEGEAAAAMERVTAVQRRLVDHAGRLTDIAKARAELKELKDLEKLTVAFRKRLVADLRPQIEETTADILSALSAGRHPAIRISEDYEIEVLSSQPSGWLPVAMMSGGEKTRINFALRLALTRLVSQRTGCPLRFLVMDEIFGSQDPDHRAKILDTLRQVQVFYPQVFLISHVGDLREQAQVEWVVQVADGDREGRVSLERVGA